jgi:hypothetical protein
MTNSSNKKLKTAGEKDVGTELEVEISVQSIL